MFTQFNAWVIPDHSGEKVTEIWKKTVLMFLTYSVEFLDTELGQRTAECCRLSLSICCAMAVVHIYLLAICRPSGCTVESGVVGIGVVIVVVVGGVCNRSQMRTSKRTCLIFGVNIGLDPG